MYKKNIYKVGYTTKTPSKRAIESYKTGVPVPFDIEFTIQVKHARKVETQIHKLLKNNRVNDDREFFEVPLEKIRAIFQRMNGIWYDIKRATTNYNVPQTNMSATSETWSLKKRRLRRKCKHHIYAEDHKK